MRIDSLYLKDVGPFDEVTIDFPAGTRDDLADVYLLTGENGCGKSTVLYAIAAAVMGGNTVLGPELATQRFRSRDALVALTAAGSDYAVAFTDHPIQFKSRELKRRSSAGAIGFFRAGTSVALWGFGSAATRTLARPTPVEHAAFAYAGSRNLTQTQFTGVESPTWSPYENALGFTSTVDSERLLRWVAYQAFRQAKAELGGRHDEGLKIRSVTRDIEVFVSNVTGEFFEFDAFNPDFDGVRILRDGGPIEPHLLPDGLKSIVSWVTDLLARLERIPWVDDVPTTKRSFLLLLDEIDIHLHPAWQRRILPAVARLFPKAQIIASTHSPFVVGSAGQDARIIRFNVKDGRSTLDPTPRGAQVGTSVSVVLADVFGVKSEFDIHTEALLDRFREARHALLTGTSQDRAAVDALAREIAALGEELNAIMGLEMRQLDRLLTNRAQAAS